MAALAWKEVNDSLPQGPDQLRSEAARALEELKAGLAAVVAHRDYFPALPFYCNRLGEYVTSGSLYAHAGNKKKEIGGKIKNLYNLWRHMAAWRVGDLGATCLNSAGYMLMQGTHFT